DRDPGCRREQEPQALLEIDVLAPRDPDGAEADLLELGGGLGDLARVAFAELRAPDSGRAGRCHGCDRTPAHRAQAVTSSACTPPAASRISTRRSCEKRLASRTSE